MKKRYPKTQWWLGTGRRWMEMEWDNLKVLWPKDLSLAQKRRLDTGSVTVMQTIFPTEFQRRCSEAVVSTSKLLRSLSQRASREWRGASQTQFSQGSRSYRVEVQSNMASKSDFARLKATALSSPDGTKTGKLLQFTREKLKSTRLENEKKNCQ